MPCGFLEIFWQRAYCNTTEALEVIIGSENEISASIKALEEFFYLETRKVNYSYTDPSHLSYHVILLPVLAHFLSLYFFSSFMLHLGSTVVRYLLFMDTEDQKLV